MKLLTAFCDLKFCPISYDFGVWLVRAMMERDARGCDALHVVLVPHEQGLGGFSRHWGEHTEHDTRWRLWHIAMPLAGLASATLTLAATRDQAMQMMHGECWWAAGPAHHAGPIIDASRGGVTVPLLQSSVQARLYVARWLGRDRVATITLRQSLRDPARNSNLMAWSAWREQLSALGYRVEWIEDSDIALSAGRGFASLDPDLRLALYQRAEVNFMGHNGTGAVCWFSDARFIQFGFGLPAATWAAHAEKYIRLTSGDQLPWARPGQRLVWRPDDIDVIREEYITWVTATN